MRRLAPCLAAALVAVTAPALLPAQGAAPLLGTWQADVPLPNGVVQTFRFEPGGSFHLLQSLTMAGTWQLQGNHVIQTVALPSGTVTDTVAVAVHGDSLTFGAGPGSKTLHRSAGAVVPSSPLVGTWTIALGNGLGATYVFAGDGTFRTRAVVSDERGNYGTTGNTLRLTSDRTFQLAASTMFGLRGDTLLLTPPRGGAGAARRFHRLPAP